MFQWWISWMWVLWVCVWGVGIGVDAGMWASSTPTHPQSILPHTYQPNLPPSHLGGSQPISNLQVAVPNAPGRLVSGPKGGKSELGPGMGGSAVEPPEGRDGTQYFATQPTPQTAVIGSTAVLPCRVINKVGHLQWTRDGFGLGTGRDLSGFSRYGMIGSDDEGDFSLRINPVLLEDDATFQCQVSASKDIPGIRSHTARLTVYVPPKHPKVRPPMLRTTAGMTVTLQCDSVGGRPPPEIQWVDDSRRETLRRGVTQSTETMEDGKTVTVTSRLTFTPRRSHHNSSVTCQTSNQALSSPLSSSIQLSVLFPPEVKLEVHPPSLIEGDDAKFICTADANPHVISYRWYHKNQELQNETSRVLILSRISRNIHQTTISCEVSNTVGTSKKTQSIHVQYGPHFRALPRDVMAEMGNEVVMKCDVDSNPPASIVWLQEGSDKIVGSGTELVVEVNENTAGVYTCVATVRGFPELKGSLRVLVKGPPMIVSSGEQEGRMGDTVSIECRTVSIPSPLRITWTYNGRDIDLNDPRYEIVVEDEHENALRNILVIHEASTNDFGAYNCSVVNEYGVARKQIRLNEEKSVPIVMVIGGICGILVVLVLILCLCLCNKRASNIKASTRRLRGSVYGSPVPEKTPNLTVVPGPPLANMYSAPSETQLSEGVVSSPALSTTPSRLLEGTTPTADEGKLRTVHMLNRLTGGETSPHTFIPDPDIDGGRGYVPFVDYTGRDYAPIPNGRRASISDLTAYTAPQPQNHTIQTADFCTIRRGMRGVDLVRDGENRNGGRKEGLLGVDLTSGITSGVRGVDLTSGMRTENLGGVRGVELNGMRGVNDMNSGMRGIPDVNNGMRGIPDVNSGMRGIPDVNNAMRGIPDVNNAMRGIPDVNNGMRGIPDVNNGMRVIPDVNNAMRGIPDINNSAVNIPSGVKFENTELNYDPTVLRHNGTAPTLSRHSVYASVRSYGSPPPPPYPRNSLIGSPRGPASPSVVSGQNDVTSSPEAKFIFSPEAMMKPGTLV